MPQLLPWILWHLLPFSDRLGHVEAVDVVSDWLSIDPDDARLAASIRTFMANHAPVTTPDGLQVYVSGSEDAPVVTWAGAINGRAELPELVAAARALMVADDPPSSPCAAMPRQDYAQKPPGYAPAPAFHVQKQQPQARQSMMHKALASAPVNQLSLF